MYFGEKVQDYKDGSGLQFIKFDFETRCQENQKFHSGEILNLNHIFFFLVDISLFSPILAFCFFQFQNNETLS